MLLGGSSKDFNNAFAEFKFKKSTLSIRIILRLCEYVVLLKKDKRFLTC